MSQENVEIVRRTAEAWNRDGAEGVLPFYDAEVEWDFSGYDGWPEERVIRGREAVAEFLTHWRAIFAAYEYGVDEYHDAGDHVLAICWQQGRFGGSAESVKMEFAQISSIRDGNVIRVAIYSDRQEALEAVGLSE